MESRKPFIHMLKSPFGFYFYDVNRNEIVSTTGEIFEILSKALEADESEVKELLSSPRIKAIKDAGYLKSKRPKSIRHPKTDFLENLLANCIEKMTLQLTQNCNFRCEYCAYTDTGNNRQRPHSRKNMSFETAIKALDFLHNHSKDADSLSIGFYGGEPLLEFELLRRVVSYANDLFVGREITYTLTTNGSLLTDEVVDYCITNNISVMVSIDGPKEIHDKNRKLADTNQGTFDLIMERLSQIKISNPRFFNSVLFNMVVDPTTDYDCYNKLNINEGFNNERMLSSFIETELLSKEYKSTEDFYDKYVYDTFLGFLAYYRRVEKDYVSQVAINTVNRSLSEQNRMRKIGTLPDTLCPGGPCIPGVARAMVDINGNVFPCERCSETSQVMKIGTLDEGFYVEKAKYILNVGHVTEDECKNCWAILHCTICAARVEDGIRICPEKKLKLCKRIRSQTEVKFKTMIMQREIPKLYPEAIDI